MKAAYTKLLYKANEIYANPDYKPGSYIKITKQFKEMKDIDELICNAMYGCCKENQKYMSDELVYDMGGYKTYEEFLEDVRSSSDTALWALCHILDGYGGKDFVDCMQIAWVEEEYIDYEGDDDIVYYVEGDDGERYFKIMFDIESPFLYHSHEVKKVTKTITVWE